MSIFNPWISKLNLKPIGNVIQTPTSDLLRVRYKNKLSILKMAKVKEEKRGAQLMKWWNGNGAAEVYFSDEHVILMEYAQNKSSLKQMALNNQDDKATKIICNVVMKLHENAKIKDAPSSLVLLSDWFLSLKKAAQQYSGVYAETWEIASNLLSTPQSKTVLHGDIHHDNILDFGKRGYLAIDPKGIVGENYYDYANIFCNPSNELATKPQRLERQLHIVCSQVNLDCERMLKWVVAYAGLSASWNLEDDSNPNLSLSIAEIAINLLKYKSYR